MLSAGAISTLMISLEISAVERIYDVHITLMMLDIGKSVGFPHHQDFLTTCLKAKFFQRQGRIWVLSLKKLKLTILRYFSVLFKNKTKYKKLFSASKFGLPLPLPPNTEDENLGKTSRSERSKIDEKRHDKANQLNFGKYQTVVNPEHNSYGRNPQSQKGFIDKENWKKWNFSSLFYN